MDARRDLSRDNHGVPPQLYMHNQGNGAGDPDIIDDIKKRFHDASPESKASVDRVVGAGLSAPI